MIVGIARQRPRSPERGSPGIALQNGRSGLELARRSVPRTGSEPSASDSSREHRRRLRHLPSSSGLGAARSECCMPISDLGPLHGDVPIDLRASVRADPRVVVNVRGLHLAFVLPPTVGVCLPMRRPALAQAGTERPSVCWGSMVHAHPGLLNIGGGPLCSLGRRPPSCSGSGLGGACTPWGQRGHGRGVADPQRAVRVMSGAPLVMQTIGLSLAPRSCVDVCMLQGVSPEKRSVHRVAFVMYSLCGGGVASSHIRLSGRQRLRSRSQHCSVRCHELSSEAWRHVESCSAFSARMVPNHVHPITCRVARSPCACVELRNRGQVLARLRDVAA